MKHFFFDKILQNDGWKSDVMISVDAAGIITSIKENVRQGEAEHIKGLAIPGFQNAHSHAFQYAMAGLAEVHDISHTSDDFWSWRDAMYKLALSVSPDQMESIASMLYAEMLLHGYTNVAEFHYVHHDKDGKQYNNLSEMGERMIAAAKRAGIGITLVPIFYQKGGFGKKATEGQRRFLSQTTEDYFELLEASKKSALNYEHANVGIGIHSMRGVAMDDIVRVATEGDQDIPFHIHIAEQLKEIEDSVSFSGKRPVEWLMDSIDINNRFHLVHATHLSEDETRGIANSKANVVICPSTEGNLGDGIFPLRDFQQMGGSWSIGTDSHVGINPLEELRILDYGQRLITHQRNTFTSPQTGNSGEYALAMATAAGRKAMNNFDETYFAIGSPLNASILESNSPLLETSADDKLASTIVYTADATHQKGTIANGKFMKKGICTDYELIKSNFHATLKELNNR